MRGRRGFLQEDKSMGTPSYLAAGLVLSPGYFFPSKHRICRGTCAPWLCKRSDRWNVSSGTQSAVKACNSI